MIKPKRAIGLWTAAVAIWLAAAACSSVRPGEMDAGGGLTVFVSSSFDSRPLNGVTVFVLSENGRVLSQGVTAGNGVVRIRKPALSERPAYLLAEHRDHFLGGLRWDDRFDEHLIVLAPGAVM